MNGTRTRSSLALALFVCLAAVGAVPASAAPPQAVTFAMAGEFASPPGVFTSGGGIVCSSGSTTDEGFFFTGGQSDVAVKDAGGLVFHALKTVTCDDGSGTFTMLIQARTGFNVGFEGTFGRWVVVSGTGDYVNLHGQGSVTGTYTPNGDEPTGLNEVFVGWLALR